MIKPEQYNPTLTRFYKDLDAWIKDGTPSINKMYFLIDVGICNNLRRWCIVHGYYGAKIEELKSILAEELRSDLGTHVFPFDTPTQYFAEPNKFTNAMRVSYIHFRATID